MRINLVSDKMKVWRELSFDFCCMSVIVRISGYTDSTNSVDIIFPPTREMEEERTITLTPMLLAILKYLFDKEIVKVDWIEVRESQCDD